jgi:hypothetical protein
LVIGDLMSLVALARSLKDGSTAHTAELREENSPRAPPKYCKMHFDDLDCRNLLRAGRPGWRYGIVGLNFGLGATAQETSASRLGEQSAASPGAGSFEIML